MSDATKRELGALDGHVAVPAAKKFKSDARLGDDRVAAMPVGSNLIEVDGKSCTHEVCWPPAQQGSNEPPKAREGPPAREYPFKLDPFQQTAINALEAGERGRERSGQGGKRDTGAGRGDGMIKQPGRGSGSTDETHLHNAAGCPAWDASASASA